ncbi:sodium-dependent transporter [Acanthopleuribacter pedis]|uniref:Sodium-dependent transporter n=1 Tax=Acanthopleuribacter pedis TaxID=442870 RepID=A0A8J7U340_9BACT|nr:sodium-dependent transporter [Acanthopleuribacter pedis]MBO1319232.1 sodium-dependent transporter [Acanthopleuribacter pedis]
MSNQRDQWSSSLGFVLAAAGSAVGLGNLWKFPYITWDNQGGGFVLVYLACILLVGMPVMMAEIVIGRFTQESPVPAFEKAAKSLPLEKFWPIVGWLGVISGLVILSFYAVVAGWSISSFYYCLKWTFSGYSPDDLKFGDFVGNGPLQLGLTLAFSTITAFIVTRGIAGGIEKATKVLMPVLLSILVLLTLNSFTLDGAGKAIAFIFTPSPMKHAEQGILEALGHAFFTLSLGMGAMITYGSYMGKKESIVKASVAIVLLDTVIALMASFIMFTILFSFPSVIENMGKSTAGMLFVTLPAMFYTEMPFGNIIAPIFYILVGFAALSSTISLLEVVVSLFIDKMKWSRLKATGTAAGTIFLFSILCALSNGGSEWLTNFKLFGQADSGFFYTLNKMFFADKAGFMNAFDHLSANWLLPVGGFFITLFVGWVFPAKSTAAELGMLDASGNPTNAFKAIQFSLRFIAPLAIGYIILKIFLGADFT